MIKEIEFEHDEVLLAILRGFVDEVVMVEEDIETKDIAIQIRGMKTEGQEDILVGGHLLNNGIRIILALRIVNLTIRLLMEEIILLAISHHPLVTIMGQALHLLRLSHQVLLPQESIHKILST